MQTEFELENAAPFGHLWTLVFEAVLNHVWQDQPFMQNVKHKILKGVLGQVNFVLQETPYR